MTDDRKRQMMQAQMRDVEEMDAILNAAANGHTAGGACSEILGGNFNLSGLVATGIETHLKY